MDFKANLKTVEKNQFALDEVFAPLILHNQPIMVTIFVGTSRC